MFRLPLLMASDGADETHAVVHQLPLGHVSRYFTSLATLGSQSPRLSSDISFISLRLAVRFTTWLLATATYCASQPGPSWREYVNTVEGCDKEKFAVTSNTIFVYTCNFWEYFVNMIIANLH